MMAPLGLALTLAFGQLVFPAPPTHPTVAELQPLVGEPVTSTAASEVLGTAATVDGEAGPWRWHRFPALGVTARVDAVAGTIALLVLHGARGKGHGRYEVALPEGLTFGHDQAQVRDQLGEPTVKQSRLRRWEYWERGLDVVFRSGGRNIKEVHVRAELPPGSAEVRLAKPRVISNPARAPVALSVDVQSRVTPGDAVGRLLLHVELETADGQRVTGSSERPASCPGNGPGCVSVNVVSRSAR